MIVDFGMGNLGSNKNMLTKVKPPSQISSSLEDISNALKIILSGGAFDKARNKLHELKLGQVLRRNVTVDDTYILGICLEMQFLTKRIEEGQGLIDAETKHFSKLIEPFPERIPHMGCNKVSLRKDSMLFDGMPNEKKFYFVHSYYEDCYSDKNVISITEYGSEFSSTIAPNNVFGALYHPQNSHKYGMKLLSNFSSL